MNDIIKNIREIPFEYPRSFLENIVINGPIGIMMTDYDFNIKYLNPISLEIHNIKKEDFNKNLKLIDYILEPEKITNIKESLISEKENNVCITYDIVHNEEIRTIRAKINLARDEYYYPIGGFFFICEDITEEKRLIEKTLEIEKFEVVQKMIVTYNHEMNNIIAIIMGRAELLLRRFDEDDKHLKNVQEIYESSKKLAEIVKKISEIKEIKDKNYVDNIKMIDINYYNKEL